MGVEFPLGYRANPFSPSLKPGSAVNQSERLIPSFSPTSAPAPAPEIIPIDAGFGLHLGCAGIEGDAWVSSPNQTAGVAGKIGHYICATKTYTSFQMPSPPSTFSPAGIVVSPANGHVYVASQGADAFWDYDPVANTWVNMPIPSIATGLDRIYLNPLNGNIFTAMANPSGTYSAFNWVFTEYNVTTEAWNVVAYNIPDISVNGQGICIGDEGIIWFITAFGTLITMFSVDPVTYQIISMSPIYNITSSARLGIFYFACDGGDGYIYLSLNGTTSAGNYIGRVPKVKGTSLNIDTFPTGVNTVPDAICLGPDGGIWASDFNNSQLIRLDRSSGNVTLYPFPSSALTTVGVFIAPDGSVLGTATGLVVQALTLGSINISQLTLGTGVTISSGTVNPNGNVAGTELDLYFQNASGASNWWICETTGTALTAVWTQFWAVNDIGTIIASGEIVAEKLIALQAGISSSTLTVTTPAVPASGVAYTNNLGYNVIVDVGGGAVTAIEINAFSMNVSGGSFPLREGDKITLTYTTAPTWIFRNQ